MNRILCYLATGCQHSHHLRWLDRMKRIVEQIETAADLEDNFHFCVPTLSSLMEDAKERNVGLFLWHEENDIDDIDNLQSITVEIIRNYADGLLAAADRIDASGTGVAK